MKNRMPTLLVSKASLNNEPFKILPVLRHILEKYENLHMAQPSQIDKDSTSKFVPPRLFSLFPNSGLGWRFIKVGAQNLTGIFLETKQEKQINGPPFDHNQRQFFQMFDFKKLGFRRYYLDKHFRSCTVGPGRKDAFVSYHEGTDVHRLPSAAYYGMDGTVNARNYNKVVKKA
ncbi:hypothetical protein BCV72DRAFT_319517 [Rhizopus microsporus var. microsporus]|uniref:Uncharacterized protein n=1 Tax=Rhizopus microsporus var. microsporus TaxID=86635 RepID=A0A1X0RBU7_RHIZD|nr:hypothetical protein BCV72DRAFT_319517 [Rhizopus microsporus var. microsporus]